MAPALASWNGYLYLAWTGTDLRLNLMRSADGQAFGGRQPLGQRSYVRIKSSLPLPPALAATASGLNLAWTGGDRRLNVITRADASDTRNAPHVVLPERAMCSPWLSSGHGAARLSWAGPDGHLYIASARDGGFSAPTRLSAATSIWPGYAKLWFGHGVCTVADQEVVAWLPPGRRRRTPVKLALLHGDELLRPVDVEARPRSGPALAAAGDVAVVTWTGRHRRIHAMTFSPTHGPGPIVRLPARTRDRAVAATHNSTHFLAWPDLRGRLTIAPLHQT